jgi:hypothetical protein
MHDPYAVFLWTAALLLLLAGVVGLLLLLAPIRAAALIAFELRWSPLTHAFASLDRVYKVERFFYRHHRQFGALLLAGSVYTLVQLIGLAGGKTEGLAMWLDVATSVLIGGNAVALVLGLIVLVRPSLLKEPERLGNRWITIAGSPLTGRSAGDRVFFRHPRLLGGFIFGSAAYALVEVFRWL